MKNQSLFTVIIITAIITALSSCYTADKATQQASKAIDKYPKNVLPLFRGKFPCITTAVTTTIDSTDLVKFKDSVNALHEFYNELLDNVIPETIEKHDTIQDLSFCNAIMRRYERNEGKYKEREATYINQVKDLKERINKTPPIREKVVEKIRDSAKFALLHIQIKDKDFLINSLAEKNESKRQWIMWLLIALLGSIVGNVLQFKKIL